MIYSEAKEQLRLLVEEFFGDDSTVIFNNQSRTVKPPGNLVVIGFGSPRRHTNINNSTEENNDIIGNYQTQVSVTIDYFSHGKAVTDENDRAVAYEDDAADKMLAFANFLNSDYVIDWCYRNDTAVNIEGEIQDLTAVVNDTSYEYRARVVMQFYFTQRVEGYKASSNVAD